jgi:hypothetical protein
MTSGTSRSEAVAVTVEPYVDYPRLIEAMGVSRSTIKRWVREGMPSETWGMARTRRFQISACIEWRRAREVSTLGPDDQPASGVTPASLEQKRK